MKLTTDLSTELKLRMYGMLSSVSLNAFTTWCLGMGQLYWYFYCTVTGQAFGLDSDDSFLVRTEGEAG
jgi:hypothetical protein